MPSTRQSPRRGLRHLLWIVPALIAGVVGVAFMLPGVLGILSGLGWSPASVATAQQRGDDIVDALQAYRAANGKYPASLDELTPRFLSEIPETGMPFNDWIYTRRDDWYFTLMFANRSSKYPCSWTTSAQPKRWQTDQ